MSRRYPGGVVSATAPTVTAAGASGLYGLTEQTQYQSGNKWPPFKIGNSLRFRSAASALLSRTPTSAGNRRTWTWSGWVKRGILSSTQVLFSCRIDASNDVQVFFDSSNKLTLSSNVGGSEDARKTPTMVFRDPSAWYHIVIVFNAPSLTIDFYINGVQVTAWDENNQPSNVDAAVNSTALHRMAVSVNATQYFDGYLSEVNFVDGQALTPASFGGTDKNGVWSPIAYTGSYGTNGFYLPFNDTTSATTLGADKSGNNNNWTLSGLNVSTANATYDIISDTPVDQQSGDVSRAIGNYATLNPVADGALFASGQTLLTLTNGNLSYGSSGRNAFGNIGVTSGKWYWECVNTNNTATAVTLFGAVTMDIRTSVYGVYYQPSGSRGLGTLNSGASEASYGATWTDNDVIGVALDMDAATPTIIYYKNGASQGSISVSNFAGKTVVPWIQNGANSGNMSGFVNFGQRPFAHSVPSGYKALNTTNLPEPTIKQPNRYFDINLYSGAGSTPQTITNSGFQPDLVWTKPRSSVGENALNDSVRGASKLLITSSSGVEATDAQYLTSFNSNGYSLGTNNWSATTVVGWQWNAGGVTVTNTSGTISSQARASQTAGFGIVTYTGNGSAGATVGHGIGTAPKMLIIKARDGSGYSWKVYHGSLGTGSHLELESTSTAQGDIWNSTAPSSTVFTLGTNAGVNENGKNYVAYCFAEIEGYSKFGSYTGNGSADGPFLYTGFKTRFILIKSSSTAQSWQIYDTSRSPSNLNSLVLFPNLTNAEQNQASAACLDSLSNGFKIRVNDAGSNGSGQTYIFMAFAENPFKYARAR